MLKIGIVDDEQLYLDKIYDILVNNIDDIRAYKYKSVDEIDDDIDFLLLDIDMPDMDGISFSKKHRDKKIVFVTNYDTRVKEAFGPNIYGYVSKSNLKEELIEKVNEVIEMIKSNVMVTFKENWNDIDIRMDDIIYCKSLKNRRVKIISDCYGEIIVNETSLKKVTSKLDDRFIEITRNTVVNSNKIISFVGDGVYLTGVKQKLDVSIRKRNILKKIVHEEHE